MKWLNLILGEEPGLGLELNDDVCRQHIMLGTLYFGETV
jgi:hypothetical protein